MGQRQHIAEEVGKVSGKGVLLHQATYNVSAALEAPVPMSCTWFQALACLVALGWYVEGRAVCSAKRGDRLAVQRCLLKITRGIQALRGEC